MRTEMAERADEIAKLMSLATVRPGDILFNAFCAGVAVWHGEWVLVLIVLICGWAVNVGWKVWLRRKRDAYRARQ